MEWTTDGGGADFAVGATGVKVLVRNDGGKVWSGNDGVEYGARVTEVG